MTMELEPKQYPLPKEVPVLPVRDIVLFPHAVTPLTVGRESSVNLINSLGEDKIIAVTAQHDPRIDDPTPGDLNEIGTSALVHKVIRMPNQSLFTFVEGLERVRLHGYTQTAPFLKAGVEKLTEIEPENTPEMEALQRYVVVIFQQIVAASPG